MATEFSSTTACTMGFTIGRWGMLNAGTTSLFSSALRTTILASKGNTSLLLMFLFLNYSKRLP